MAARVGRLRRQMVLWTGGTILVGIVVFGALIMWMPGKSYRGALPALTARQADLRDDLRRDLQILARDIGDRGVHAPKQLRLASEFLAAALTRAGYEVRRQAYSVAGVTCENLDVEIRGTSRPNEILIIGAHYDTVEGTVGANDNGSGVVATLALARAFAGKSPARTLRFALFVNEEPPWFQTPQMGSYVYARACRERGENIVGMISLETIGYYSDEPGSQQYPPPFNLFYPTTGNFAAFVGNLKSRAFVCDVVGSFRSHAQFPSEGIAAPEFIPESGFSDQWAFWQFGYPALMVTDTAMFRYPHYHSTRDTVECVNFERLARLVDGMTAAVEVLASPR